MNLISTVSFLLVILGTLKGHAQATCSLGPDSDPNGKSKVAKYIQILIGNFRN